MQTIDIQAVKEYLLSLQDAISDELSKFDQDIVLQEDQWSRPEGGGGRTRAFSNGAVFEKAGVNFSHVWGHQLPAAATIQRPELNNCTFEALGLSLIIHPLNPYVPTCHANLRLFSATTAQQKKIWWFGGGFDLTPYYGFKEDCIHWHKVAKDACDPFGENVYERYKEWADNYFYLKHRNEARGIGGLFFDDLNEWPFDRCFDFIKSVGDRLAIAYFPIVALRQGTPYTQSQREFQLYRRGRYVEFNLLYDRGTLFGLQSGGRIESILISLPPLVRWLYDWQPTSGSQEELLYEFFLQPKDWVNLSECNYEK